MRIYRSLLRLLPREFREQWGAEAEELLRFRLREAHGSPQRAWVWTRAVADLIRHGVAERLRPSEDMWGGGGMRTLWEDIRFGSRSLWSSRWLSGLAVLTLALGIGAATATYSVVHTVLIRDLPYESPERLVAVWPEANFNKALTLEAAELSSLEAVGGVSFWTLTLTGEGEPLEVTAGLVAADHFEILGEEAALGRTFREEEELPGRAGVAVLSHDLWVRAFGADPAAIGRSVGLAGAEYELRTIIGVMPASHRSLFGEAELWVPLEHDPAMSVEDDNSWYVNWRVARLAPGVTLAQADAEVARFARDTRDRLPRIFDEEEAQAGGVQPLAAFVADGFERPLKAALGAVGLVLLIACVNVANLLLARGETRSRDLAVRVALGAERGRVIRMLLAEGSLMGLAGGVLGIGLAHGLLALLLSRAPADFPRISEMSIDGSILGFAVGVTALATLLAALYPALRASRGDGGVGGLPSSARGGAARRRSRLSRVLVGVEVALALVVAVGSGLMLRSLGELMSVETGLDTEGVLTLRANPPGGRYPDGEAFRGYYESVLQQLEALPGVTSAGAIQILPGLPNNWSFPTHPEGVEIAEGAAVPSVNFRATTEGYLATVGLELARGRWLSAADNADGEDVLVVNEAFVEQFWPGEDPIGRSVRIFSSSGSPSRVVGVVGDVRQHGLGRAPRPEMYFAHAQVPWDQMAMYVVVRFADGEPLAHAAEVREAVWSVDADVPIAAVESLDQVFGRSAATTTFLATLLTAFGVFSLLLGSVGVFGVTSYEVAQRRPEFGVRIALGSSRADVLRTGLSAILAPVAFGLVAGLGIALGAGRMLSTVLYEIEPTDPVTLTAVASLLAACGLVAALAPAWRATGVDPVSVLNSE